VFQTETRVVADDVPLFTDFPRPSEFPWGQPPPYRIPGPENGVAGRTGRGHRLRSRFPLEFSPVQGLEYCHRIRGFL
jgi:hypothetical protein